MSSKPQSPVPASLKGTDEKLTIEWRDGTVHHLSWRYLRDHCPCATCRVKRTEPPQPEPARSEPESLLPVIDAREAQPLRITGMRPVGNYAYGIAFNDGHESGIYSLEYLYALGEQAARD